MSDLLSYEEYLDRYGQLKYSNIGTTMLPLFRQGNALFIVTKKGPERCHIGDVVLCRRPPDRYVLCRVIDVRPDDYVILCDNSVTEETGIRDADILGVVTGFVRNGKRHSVAERGYQAFSSVWMTTAPIRITSKKLAAETKRVFRKIIKR